MNAGFDELESKDIEDIPASHTEELTNEGVQLLTEHSPVKTTTTKKNLNKRYQGDGRSVQHVPASNTNPYR
ncbi:hypothetical protein Hamer_G001613 [Homarus americanus]|uniref:Uncharacterized protein n=1 Tax=Homarus americanus TaxID=6706 RepID=A0A8J5MQZ6_HOMAM|nr:hypothetical protein Hamer_G001613 [Homarus americanus]